MMDNKFLLGIFFSYSFAYCINANDINYNKELLSAVERADIEEIKAALSKGADLEITEPGSGFTPLFIAVADANVELVKFLLQQGAHINVKDTRNFTPLDVAIQNGHSDIVKVLLNDDKIRVSQQDLKLAKARAKHLQEEVDASKKRLAIYNSLNNNAQEIEFLVRRHIRRQ